MTGRAYGMNSQRQRLSELSHSTRLTFSAMLLIVMTLSRTNELGTASPDYVAYKSGRYKELDASLLSHGDQLELFFQRKGVGRIDEYFDISEILIDRSQRVAIDGATLGSRGQPSRRC